MSEKLFIKHEQRKSSEKDVNPETTRKYFLLLSSVEFKKQIIAALSVPITSTNSCLAELSAKHV